jgi:hypothetical protein
MCNASSYDTVRLTATVERRHHAAELRQSRNAGGPDDDMAEGLRKRKIAVEEDLLSKIKI